MKNISVCIATYNGEMYIKQQLNSILTQLTEDDEVIISDDSSTDNTLDIIRSYKDPRIKIFQGQKFKSPIYNFENAIQKATNSIIFLSDQDDIWHPDKVKIMKEHLNNFDTAVCDCAIVDEQGNVLLSSFFSTTKSKAGLVNNLIKNKYLGCCLAFNRKILDKALPFPKDIPMHDIWLGFVSELFYKPVFIDKILTYYRRHDSNASSASVLASRSSFADKMRYRINLVKYIPLLYKRNR